MFCKNCGEQIDDNAVVCPKCGVAVKEVAATTASDDAPNMGFAVLGFFFPIRPYPVPRMAHGVSA